MDEKIVPQSQPSSPNLRHSQTRSRPQAVRLVMMMKKLMRTVMMIRKMRRKMLLKKKDAADDNDTMLYSDER